MDLCFGEGPATPQNGKDLMTRNGRFFEEACELAQSNGMTQREAIAQVVYTFNRPVGRPGQEIGGVMVTLAALANNLNLWIDVLAQIELDRISSLSMIEHIRAKQATKPRFGTLPGDGYTVGDEHDDYKGADHE